MAVEKYKPTVDPEFIEGDEKPGIHRITFTPNPAIKLKGYAFEEQLRKVFFNDDKKMRIAAPILVPMEVYRKADDEDPEHNLVFTAVELEEILTDMMKDFNSKDFFNKNHTEEIVPAFLREVWQVEDPKTDKSFTQFEIEVPRGTIFAVVQLTDEAYYNQLVKEGATGLSIEAYFGRKLVEMNAEGLDYADVIVFNEEGKTLLLKRTADDTFEPLKYGFPGGKIEEGEDPKTAAARELEEETGLKPGELVHVGVIENEDGTKSHYFTAVTKGEKVEISNEHSDYAWLEVEEIKDKDVILNDTKRFTELATKAKNKITNNLEMEKDLKLAEGEQTINGKVYIVDAEGNLVLKKVETELTDDEKKAAETKLAEEAEAKKAKLEEVKKKKADDVELSDEEKTMLEEDEKEVKLAEDKKAEENKLAEEKKVEELEEAKKKKAEGVELSSEEEALLAEEGGEGNGEEAVVITEEQIGKMIDAKVEPLLEMIGELKAKIEEGEAADGDEGGVAKPTQMTKMESHIERLEKVTAFHEQD